MLARAAYALAQLAEPAVAQGPTTEPARRVRVPGDTFTVVHPPPGLGPIDHAVRWFFSVPQWVQWTGIVIALLLALALLVVAWLKRAAIADWFRTRDRGWKVAVGSTAVVALLVAGAFGAMFYTYTQHDNQFCVACHTLHDEVYERFLVSEHKQQECHDCHKESMFASVMQVVKWISFRPEEVGPHAPVATRVCGDCHIREDPDSTWQHIIATAGHQLHLQSDTGRALNVQCVTCHGVRIHRFAPVDQTCGQAGCHEQQEIKLAKMRDQTDLHCAVCHEFAAPVAARTAALAGARVSGDSAKRILVPRLEECFSCHQMRLAIENFDPNTEPHGASCGTCHNPHEQETPKAAFQTCQNSGCHARADTITPFHRGLRGGVLADCGSCHQAHSWTLSGDKCLTCHRDVVDEPATGTTRRPARSALAPRPAASPAPAFALSVPAATFAGYAARIYAARAASQAAQPRAGQPRAGQRARLGYQGDEPFSHRRHREVECTQCHATGQVHGALKVRTVRDCQSCHHAPARAATAAQCTGCHQAAELRGQDTVATAMRLSVWREPRSRSLPFRHEWHGTVACTTCHTTPVTLAPARDCASCHTEHHTVQQECRFCHRSGRPTHTRQAHLGCAGSGCHTMQGTVALEPVRNVCLTCHQDMVNHKPGRECAQCHQVRWLGTPRAAGTE